MPEPKQHTYDITMGGNTYTVTSPHELTDVQAYQAAKSMYETEERDARNKKQSDSVPDRSWLEAAAGSLGDTALQTGKGILEGLTVDPLRGAAQFLHHPIDTTASVLEGAAGALEHPIDTLTGLAKSASDPETGGRMIGGLLLPKAIPKAMEIARSPMMGKALEVAGEYGPKIAPKILKPEILQDIGDAVANKGRSMQTPEETIPGFSRYGGNTGGVPAAENPAQTIKTPYGPGEAGDPALANLDEGLKRYKSLTDAEREALAQKIRAAAAAKGPQAMRIPAPMASHGPVIPEDLPLNPAPEAVPPTTSPLGVIRGAPGTRPYNPPTGPIADLLAQDKLDRVARAVGGPMPSHGPAMPEAVRPPVVMPDRAPLEDAAIAEGNANPRPAVVPPELRGPLSEALGPQGAGPLPPSGVSPANLEAVKAQTPVPVSPATTPEYDARVQSLRQRMSGPEYEASVEDLRKRIDAAKGGASPEVNLRIEGEPAVPSSRDILMEELKKGVPPTPERPPQVGVERVPPTKSRRTPRAPNPSSLDIQGMRTPLTQNDIQALLDAKMITPEMAKMPIRKLPMEAMEVIKKDRMRRSAMYRTQAELDAIAKRAGGE